MYNIIQNKKNKDNLVTFLKSELIHFILLITQYSRQGMHKNEFKILNMISKPTPKNKFKNDNDIYKYYNISASNVEYIKKIIASSKTKTRKNKPTSIKTRKQHAGSSRKHTRKRRSLAFRGGAKTRKRSKKKRRHKITRRLKRRQGGAKTRKRSKKKRRHKITRRRSH
jgi:hypothetical protein